MRTLADLIAKIEASGVDDGNRVAAILAIELQKALYRIEDLERGLAQSGAATAAYCRDFQAGADEALKRRVGAIEAAFTPAETNASVFETVTFIRDHDGRTVGMRRSHAAGNR
jgi:hypothetical protein